MSLISTLAAARPIEHGFAAAIPESWMQGRTSYGGFSAALALHGAQGLVPDLPPLRSAQVSFVGPLAGEVEVRSRVLRRGRNATWISTEVTSEAGVGLAATFVFMGPVETSTLHLHEVPAPEGMIAPEDAIPLPEARGAGFTQHFDRRFALPRSEVKRPDLAWWLRPKDREGLDPMVALMLTGDALPPGVMPLLDTWVPVSSMTWIVNLLTPAPASRDGWMLVRSTGNYAEAGCSSQEMTIWNADGVALSTGMQSIALFG